jgi:hypothetical protein
VTLQGGWFFDPSRIFPQTSTLQKSTSMLSARQRPWGSVLDCTLSICQDGTFVLSPTNKDSLDRRLALRGQWKILSNPYCVTDRFYDQLTLESYPRIEVQNEVPLRSVQLSLSGRMWGRYAKSRRRMNGRITHGAMICKQQGIAKKQFFRIGRPIWASFSACRSSRVPAVEGRDDKRFFGY